MNYSLLKKNIEDAIRSTLKERADRARRAMDEAQASANEEGKSSMGDKYETGRAMAQNQREMNARQWAEAVQLLENFEKWVQKVPSTTVGPGSLVETENGLFYLGPGLGKIETASQETVWALSIQSPMGKALMGKTQGEQIIWMGKRLQIKTIW